MMAAGEDGKSESAACFGDPRCGRRSVIDGLEREAL